MILDNENLDDGLLHLRLQIKELNRWEDLRTMLGWRYVARVYAWDNDEDERRWRPAPFVANISPFPTSWMMRVRSTEQGRVKGAKLAESIRKQHGKVVTREARTKWLKV